jgi:chaperone BCS1
MDPSKFRSLLFLFLSRVQVFSNTELRQLLIQTTNRSIIVIEDIDCSINLSGQRSPKSSSKRGKDSSDKDALTAEELNMIKEDESSRITLSGLLNFTDGLWSCCGDERILVFTTNHIEKLDDALLRPGRMDMHIEMSYCTFPAFKILVRNYLMIETHPLFPTVESLLVEGKHKVTPAQISEILILDKDNPDMVMDKLVAFLQQQPEEEELPGNTEAANELESESQAKARAPPSLII